MENIPSINLQVPDIFDYLDYRQYLQDIYQFKKAKNPAFSYRSFARQAGLKSWNFLKLVQERKRNLSLAGTAKFAKALRLKKAEINFFENLVLFDQAKTNEEKTRHFEKILQNKNYQKKKTLDASQYAYFSNWYYVVIRELVALKNFTEDPKWIRKKLGVNLTSSDINRAISLLIDIQLLERDQNGKLQQCDEKVTTSPELESVSAVQYHKNMIQKAKESIDKTDAHYRDISSLTLSLSKKQFEKIKERLQEFRSELHALEEEEKERDAVYQVNLQLFNLTELDWK